MIPSERIYLAPGSPQEINTGFTPLTGFVSHREYEIVILPQPRNPGKVAEVKMRTRHLVLGTTRAAFVAIALIAWLDQTFRKLRGRQARRKGLIRARAQEIICNLSWPADDLNEKQGVAS
jgi:hypothetical protein